MLKITLLKTLYHEFDRLLSRNRHDNDRNDSRFRTIHKTYPEIPEITSVTMEERYLPKSVLYYIWTNGEKKEANLNDTNLCRWIFSFAKENCPNYLKNELPEDPIGKGISILDCFEVSHIPDYRPTGAYSDLTVTTMDDVKNHRIPEDNRQATFPGIRFSEKHKRK